MERQAIEVGQRIGKVAGELKVSTSLLRVLEEQGVIEPPVRDRAGQRRYTDADVQRIREALIPTTAGRS